MVESAEFARQMIVITVVISEKSCVPSFGQWKTKKIRD